jgi:hypothetical protein
MFTVTQLEYLRKARFTPLKRYKVTRIVDGVEHTIPLQDVEDHNITYDRGMGASTLTLTVNNPDGKYNPNKRNEWNTVGGIYSPLFHYMNRIDIDLGIEFPDGSIKWWPKGPYWMDMPRFGQDEGFPEPVFVTARDGMKELLVDVFTGVFEPQKIAASQTLSANPTKTIFSASHPNICKIPTPTVKVAGKIVSDGYEIDWAAGKVYFSEPQTGTVTMSYSYYNMSTNTIGDVMRAICKDAGVYNVELDFTTPEGVLEPTVGLTEWTYEDRKTHFDCLREIITSYMPPNWMFRQKDGVLYGNYVYQSAPVSEIVPKRKIEWSKSDQDVYTKCVALGRKSDLKNKCAGASIANLYSGSKIEGGVARIIDGKVSTQCRWYREGSMPIPTDMFRITLKETIEIGAIMILIGDVDGIACSVTGTVWVSENGSEWFIPSRSAQRWRGSSSQWITIDDFDKAYRVKYLRFTMEEYGTANDFWGSVWAEFPIREVKVYEDDRLFGEATLWDSAKETKIIPDTLQISLANRGVLSHRRLQPVVEGFTLVEESPWKNQFSISYGGLDEDTILTFYSLDKGKTVDINYHYTDEPTKYELLNRVGQRTYVMADNPRLSTEDKASQDAKDLLGEVWAFYETAEADCIWCPWVEVGETYLLRNEQLGINEPYLVTGLSLDSDGARVSVANYKLAELPGSAPEKLEGLLLPWQILEEG